MDVRDDRGLSIDMLDVDRLREWARLLLVHGADIGHWGSVPHVAGRMQILATNIEKAVRDIGILRAERAALPSAPASQPDDRPWVWKCLDCNAWVVNQGRGLHTCGHCGAIKPMSATLIVCDHQPPSAPASAPPEELVIVGTCRNDAPHYCPNCDNSFIALRSAADTPGPASPPESGQ